MTPIEAMAKAFDDYADALSPRSEFRAFLRSHKHAAARAALLALADCELPDEFLIGRSFQEIIRSIANEGSLTPPKIMREDGNG